MRTHLPRGECPRCGRTRALIARGLCHPCYADPAVRALFASGKPTRRTWTALEVARLREWRAAGVTAREMAARLGRPQRAVEQRLAALRVLRLARRPDHHRERVREAAGVGETDAAVAARVGCSRQTVARWRAALGLPPACDRREAGRPGVGGGPGGRGRGTDTPHTGGGPWTRSRC